MKIRLEKKFKSQNYTRLKSFISHENYVKAFAKPMKEIKEGKFTTFS